MNTVHLRQAPRAARAQAARSDALGRGAPEAAKHRTLRAGVLAIAALALGLFLSAPSFAATLTVTKTDDTADGVCDADCSLREAITAAGAGDTIVFSAAANGTITLLSALPTITQSLTLTGNGAANTVIDGNYSGTYRCFDINPGGGTVTFSDLTVWNCSGGLVLGGAAISATNGTFHLLRAVIRGNVGRAMVYITGATTTATITDSTIVDNVGALSMSGVWVDNGAAATITASTFSGNTGSNGALALTSSATVTVTNSTFANNSTPGASVGTITVSNSTATIENSTITGSGQYGLYVGGAAADVTLSNTIIAGNAGAECSLSGGSLVSNGYNLASDGSCFLLQPTDLPNTDPQLLPLADNGGATQTLALAAGSVAIDAGSCVNAVDQRGHGRPSGATCDIGAFEFDAVAPAISASTINTTLSQPATAALTLAGTGALTLTAASDNAALLPDANITGLAGCTAAGACTLTLTPAVGQLGSATVTLTMDDTYGQQAVTTFTFNVVDGFTVTYNGNGHTAGSVPADGTAYLPGDTVTVLGAVDLARTGHTFAGWNTQPNGSGTSYAPNATFAISGSVTLYAQWTAQTTEFSGGGALAFPWLGLLLLLALRRQQCNEFPAA